MIRHLLLDLDGTLSDSREGIRNSVAHALRRLGLPAPAPQAIEAWIGPPLQESFAGYLRTLDADRIDEALGLFREYYARRGVRECAAYPGIPETLRSLHAAGHALYVATAKPTAYAVEVLRHLGIDRFFRGDAPGGTGSPPSPPRVSGSPLTGGNTSKPEIVRRILDRHGIDPADALMVGDRRHDVDGARANGVRSTAVTWGYADRAEIEAARPDFIVDRPEDLLPVAAGRFPAGPHGPSR